MRIAQIILPSASEYERKSQRADRAALSADHEVLVLAPGEGLNEAASSGATVAHVYASGELPPALFRRFPLRYVSSSNLGKSRWPFGRAAEPRYIISPLHEKDGDAARPLVPEAVEEPYFDVRVSPAAGRERKVVGSFARPGTRNAAAIRNVVDQTLARIHRFRDDVTWNLFDRVPTPDDLAGVDAWADPAIDDLDFDGFVAEALVVGLPVVAARTPINEARLERGRTGFLIPPRDPNEMTHAILTALFKREAAEGKQFAARQTASKFRPRQRIRALVSLYETLIP